MATRQVFWWTAFLLSIENVVALDLHVSSGLGSDVHGDGSAKNPFKSIDRAQGRLRQLRRHDEMIKEAAILIHEGSYPPVHLDPVMDSGAPDVLVRYAGVSADTPPVINGGRRIPSSAFSKVGSGPLVRADLFEHGISKRDLGYMVNGQEVNGCQHEKAELVFNGKLMTLARWPNIDEKGTWKFANIDEAGTDSVGVNVRLQPSLKRMMAWNQEIDPWIHGYWRFDWTDSYVGVSNLSMKSNDMLTMSLHPSVEIRKNARFYGVNLLCELDAPGEYYINKDNGTLYFMPPQPLEQWPAGMDLFLTSADVALNISGTSHVSFRNLVVSNARSTGILAEGVVAVNIDNVTISNHGQTGIVLEGQHYRLTNSFIHDVGCVGVQASGGDVPTLTSGSNLISGNTVRRHAQWKRTYMAGIMWGGVNNTFSRNHVSDGPHNCFLGGGNEIPAVACLHEENTIENCAYEASDTGAWYSCGQAGAWTNLGNVARRNLFRNIRCRIEGRSVEGCGGGVQAVYLDDQMSGWRWEENSFDNCDRALFIGGGRSNVLVGNRVNNSDLAVHFDNRGMNWQKAQCASSGPSMKDVNSLLNGPAGEQWKQRFPELLKVRDGDHLCVPVYNMIINNTASNVKRFVDASESQIAAWLSVSKGNSWQNGRRAPEASSPSARLPAMVV